MSIDNKQGGDSVFDFEINGILKAIRTLFKNFSDKWGYLGNSGAGQTSVTVPTHCNFIVASVTYSTGTFGGKADLIIVRGSKETAVAKVETPSGNNTTTLTLSGNTLSLSVGTFTAYYYS